MRAVLAKRFVARQGWWCSPVGAAPKRRLKTLEASTTGLAKVTQKNIRALLDSNNCQYTVGHASFVLHCPLCDKPRAAANGKSVFLNKTTGSMVCKPCGVSGSWDDFCQWMKTSHSKRIRSKPFVPPTRVPERELGHREAEDLWAATQPLASASTKLIDQVKEVFGINCLLPDYLKKYHVHTALAKFSTRSGQTAEVPCVAFPWFDANGSSKQEGILEGGKAIGEVIRVKLQTLSTDRQVTLEPKEGPYGLYGWNTVPQSAKKIVITAGEFDAIAVNQTTKLPAVALPNSASILPPEVLPQLEQFEKIYLWLGTDVQSRQAASKFAKKLDMDRCFLVCANDNQPFSTALEALSGGHDLNKAISAAKPFTHKRIITFQRLREEVYNELTNASQVAGVKWRRFPKLTSILKGHRPGELSVFTGPTGSGKTTLMSELSLDLCQQGVTTLWGSFEIRNVRLAKTMLKQFSGLNLEHHVKQFGYWADRFQQLPLYFMGFYGPVDIATVIETMSHATYVYDIQHVIVDNLQFMTGATYSLGDRYTLQNAVLAEFRKFASVKNVHVSLVIHPRKEDDSAELTTASIFGTAKASQEADNVLILQSRGGVSQRQKYLQVTKNRFDGDVGRLPLEFDRESLTLSGCNKQQSRDGLKRELSARALPGDGREKPLREGSEMTDGPVGRMRVTVGTDCPTMAESGVPVERGQLFGKAAVRPKSSHHLSRSSVTSPTQSGIRLGTKLSQQSSSSTVPN